MKQKRADNNVYMDWRKKPMKCKQMYLFYDFELRKAFDLNLNAFLIAVLFIMIHKPSNVHKCFRQDYYQSRICRSYLFIQYNLSLPVIVGLEEVFNPTQ